MDMMGTYKHILTLTAMMLCGSLQMMGDSFSSMSTAELVSLLGTSTTAVPTVSAKDSADARVLSLPLSLNAADMVSKVYGVLDTDLTREECISHVRKRLRLEPDDDMSALWLESDGGYAVDYYGMRPDVSALARFDHDRVCDFCYFFMFPQQPASGEVSQTDFCSTMLQEMYDLGMDLGANSMSSDIFEVIGGYDGNAFDIRLVDDADSARYILILTVEPDSAIPAQDEQLAIR